MTKDFWSVGVDVKDGWLDAAVCDEYVEIIRAVNRTEEPPLIVRRARGRSLRYKVIDGHRIASAIPDIDELGSRVQTVTEQICGTRLEPISDVVAARNVNITPPGGEYRWHYDRNAVTAIAYLNEVSGGETEVFPNYRIVLRSGRRRRLQRTLDTLVRPAPVRRSLGRRRLVAATKGSLLIMRGDRSLHSVRRVHGAKDRIIVVFAYDFPGVGHGREVLDRYLYETGEGRGDPNYCESDSVRPRVDRAEPVGVGRAQ
jgi:2OG-Fe(II) oxygenase superfamily